MKYYLISKETGEVKSISEGKIIFDENLFILKGINPTANEQELVNQNYKIKLVDDKLVFDEPVYIKEKNAEIKKQDLKTSIEGAKDISEIKEIIKKII